MKMRINVIIIIYLFITNSAIGQTGQTQNITNNLIETENGSIFIKNGIDDTDINLYVYLEKEKMSLSQDDRLVILNNTIFQILVVDETPFGKPNNVFTLKTYANTELKYIEENVYGKSVKSTFDIIDKKSTNLNVTTLFWFYEAPIGYNDQVINHLYITFSYNNKIIGIYMPQFKDQEFDIIKKQLLEVFDSMHISAQKITFEKLCNEIND